MSEKQKESTKELITRMEKRDRIVVMTIDGGTNSMNLDAFLDGQPIEGILYDLNRLPETIWTFIDNPKWVNDYAVYLVIKRLHERDVANKAKLTRQEAVVKAAREWRAGRYTDGSKALKDYELGL